MIQSLDSVVTQGGNVPPNFIGHVSILANSKNTFNIFSNLILFL